MVRSHVAGHIYLLHFVVPYVAVQQPGKKLQTARHYLGFSQDLMGRLLAHKNGQGARLTQVIKEAGIEWQLARMWPGDRFLERQLKKRGGRSRFCPLCLGVGTPLVWEAFESTAALLNELSVGA